jgi:hypothetical protein
MRWNTVTFYVEAFICVDMGRAVSVFLVTVFLIVEQPSLNSEMAEQFFFFC